MGILNVFNNITVDGYFSGVDGDFNWAHTGSHDPEWDSYVAANAGGGGTLLLGRMTYEIMAGYWPSPAATANNPVVAERINKMNKIVVSKTLDSAIWSNTTILKGDLVDAVKILKVTVEPGMTILGSGSLVAQLTEAGLIDQYSFVVIPFVLGAGRTLFGGIAGRTNLKLTSSRAFENGNVLLVYSPA